MSAKAHFFCEAGSIFLDRKRFVMTIFSMKAHQKDRLLQIRLSAGELEKAQAAARSAGVSLSQLARRGLALATEEIEMTNGKMVFGSNVNAHKKEALAGLREGMSVAEAAKLAGVSERSIRGWAKLAGITILERETPKEKAKPMSAAAAKKAFG